MGQGPRDLDCDYMVVEKYSNLSEPGGPIYTITHMKRHYDMQAQSRLRFFRIFVM